MTTTTTTGRRKVTYDASLPPITAAGAEAEKDRLTFPEPRPAEKDITIQIDAGPDGIRVRCAYVGPLSSIPAAIERLRAAGVLELVSAARVASPPAEKPARKQAAQTTTPIYQPDGTACCPKHLKPLKQGQWGLYCPARDNDTERGYCNLKFAD